MDIVQAAVLGLVEGTTEFLPISSTGHLIVVGAWLGIAQDEAKTAFDVIVQLAAILAVVITCRDKFTRAHVDLWRKVILAFIPIGVAGVLAGGWVEGLFSVQVVAVAFIAGGVIFLLVEYFNQDDCSHVIRVEDLTRRQAAWIGVAQVFALIPGTSRAGATIIGALLVGSDRRTSAEFSFLLALPVMIATTGYEAVKHHQAFGDGDLVALGMGFITAFTVAWLTMRWLLRFVARFTFVAFGIYRILFGLALLIWFS
ncbi:undecaprenyl-diphosphate phosphatase [Celeribacter persicus]|uniref:Undecaprenyl-diphosphatase n=1 Tax=Celeribacter persicus TaxID=1651082 RepID=A0A2T5H401_9RHOB|nr:undecaprenyl-diphosphate phosphatase [Celeribacter persicus]PTQ66254.1 undecaprenyl-diphosphatase [Celeribacter persicus]